jgi:hypothetical protein
VGILTRDNGAQKREVQCEWEFRVVMRGLDPRIHLSQTNLGKKLDRRVEPGDDDRGIHP